MSLSNLFNNGSIIVKENAIVLTYGVLLVVPIGIVLQWIVRQFFFSPLRSIPSPVGAAIFPWQLIVAASRWRRAQKLLELHRQYGSLVRIGPNEVSISDWKYYRPIYAHPKASSKEPGFYLSANFVQQKSIFSMTNKAEHAARRKLSAGPYSLQSVAALEPMVREKANRLVKRLLEQSKTSPTGSTNAFHLCGMYSLEVVCEAGSAKKFPQDDTADLVNLLTSMDGSALTFIYNSLMPWLRPSGIAHKLPICGPSYQCRIDWERCVRSMLKEFLDLPQKDEKYLLTPYVTATDTFLGRKLNNEEFVEEAMGILFAGSGTTSTTLTYLLYALSRPGHEEIQRRLREELRNAPSLSDMTALRGLPYLNAVIKETFRVYPTIISSLPRVLDESMVVEGHSLPAGTIVNMQNYVHHRDPTLFPNPENFSPERWLVSTADMEAALTPFSLGRRGCIGQNLAWDELYIAVSLIFHDLQLKLGKEMTEADMEMQDRFNIAPVGRKLMLEAVEV